MFQVPRILLPRHLFYTLDALQLLYQVFELDGIIYKDGYIPAEEIIARTDIYCSKGELILFMYYTGDITDDTDVIISHKT